MTIPVCAPPLPSPLSAVTAHILSHRAPSNILWLLLSCHQVALHDELRQLSVGFAEGHDTMAAAAAGGDGADRVEDEGEGSMQRVSAVKARILARQLTPLHSSNARARRASGLATAGEVGLAPGSAPFPGSGKPHVLHTLLCRFVRMSLP